MNQEIKICQNCKKDFIIDPDDFAFYEKIKVPPPTWCPECRLKRILVWRNERILYKRKCNLCGKSIITIYHPDSPYAVYCLDCYWSDKWDPYSYARTYNFKKPFFEQLGELFFRTPKRAMGNTGANNCEYVNNAIDNSNCYLIFNSGNNEDSSYSSGIRKCRDVMDVHYGENLEQCYGVVNAQNCSRCTNSENISDCVDVHLSMDLRGCQNCFGCVDLTRKNYHFFNVPLSKEQWEEKIKDFFGSLNSLSLIIKKFKEFSLKFPKRYSNIYKSSNCIGDYIFESKNAKNCLEAMRCEDCKNGLFVRLLKDSIDVAGFGYNSELLLSCMAVGYSSRVIGCSNMKDGQDVYYSLLTNASQECIGCDGLKNAKNCVLNKQYTQEEYEKIKNHIIEELKQKGVYGLGLPSSLSPWAYNETMAQEIFPLTKEQALEQGYSWKDPEPRDYQITIKPQDLPDHIKDVPETITKEVIGCSHEGKCNEQCTEAFRIIPQELQFYRKMNLPLPRLCPNCRHYGRLKQRNPLKLWKRQCQCTGEKSENGVYQNTTSHNHGNSPCPHEFETPYSPDRPEIVYCEECYLKEVV
ncbi:MAG: hypothetical protein PHN39_03780 [Candidatus Pacebacteria bacterium]|nr:hypothetical protein [Candidatus Paceibacterota bacterium]